jgi:glycosyltransferase involved in cell wall biosynthesis
MKKSIILVGPIPPPFHGVTISTQRLLSSDLGKMFNLIHLNTSDHRDVDNIGRIDLTNVWLAIKSYFILAYYCLKYRPDVVYIPISQSLVGYARDAFYIIIPKLFSKSKIVIHLRGGYFGTFYDDSNILFKVIINNTMRFVDRAIVLGKCFKPIFYRWFKEEKIDVVPNGTDINIDVSQKFKNKKERHLTVTFMSSLIRSKGVVDFVLAALKVVKQHPKTEFIVAGEWWNQEAELKSEVENILAGEENNGNIRFLGLVTGDAKVSLLKETDIFVLPTYYPFEGQPNSIIEAMAAGCPVISTDHATIPETVINGETGYIIPKQDPQKLVEAITYLIENRDVLKSMASKSFERYQNCYTAERSNQLLINSLQRVLES